MFAGKPDKFLLNKNLSHIIDSKSDGTFYAVKHTPDKYEIENYTKRLQDGAVTYEGRLDIKNSNPQIVRLKLEKGKVVEIPLDKKVKKDSKKVEIFKRIKGKSASILATAAELKQAGMIYFDKERKSKLKECIANRKLENKLLRQYNLEKARKTFYMEHDNKKYEISTENEEAFELPPRQLTDEFIPYDGQKREITCYGDSMMAGAGSATEGKVNGIDIYGWTTPVTIEKLTNIPTHNLGGSGENSSQITFRAGGTKVYIDRDITISETDSAIAQIIDENENVFETDNYSGYGFDYDPYKIQVMVRLKLNLQRDMQHMTILLIIVLLYMKVKQLHIQDREQI